MYASGLAKTDLILRYGWLHASVQPQSLSMLSLGALSSWDLIPKSIDLAFVCWRAEL
jgi:hypothetical protein